MALPNSILASPAGTSPALRRHPDLWFDDGSVILSAERTLFRVHISQLSRHSVCFRDMFAIPQPSSNSNNKLACLTLPRIPDGCDLKDCSDCPVVYLHDKADDLGNLLTALYDGPYVNPIV